MSIIIDSPTAEAIYKVLQQFPPSEITRLREMLNELAMEETLEEEEAAWREISSASMARYLEDEEKTRPT